MYSAAVQETPSPAIAQSTTTAIYSLFQHKNWIKCDIAPLHNPHEAQKDDAVSTENRL